MPQKNTTSSSVRGISTRTKARIRSLEILYEAQIRAVAPREVLAARLADPKTQLNPYVTTLVNGVQAYQSEIDDLIAQTAIGWTLERMPTVDLNILRIAVYELRFGNQVPPAVVLDEAATVAAHMAGDDSPKFISGVLASIIETIPDATGARSQAEPDPA